MCFSGAVNPIEITAKNSYTQSCDPFFSKATSFVTSREPLEDLKP
jgi:hypothetical protein